jgi:hypothetical protein
MSQTVDYLVYIINDLIAIMMNYCNPIDINFRSNSEYICPQL